MPVFIKLTYGSTPVYRQIIQQVMAAVASGELEEGEALPTVRGLAEELGINMNTVARAYRELEFEKVVGGQSTRGVYVLPRGRMYTAAERRRRLHPASQAFLSQALLLGLSRKEILEHVTENLDQLLSNQDAREARDDEAEPGSRSSGADEALREEEGG
jgi:GntR family transcriptional regulator